MNILHNPAIAGFFYRLSLDWAIVIGAAISYLLCGMPRLVVLENRLRRFVREKSATFQGAVEFLVVVAIGWAVVHYLVTPTTTQMAFTSGLSWYSLLHGILNGRRA